MSGTSTRLFGESDYRLGAWDRLAESYLLLRAGRYAGSVYLGGRAVEGMLRAVVWRHDHAIQSGRKTLMVGHNLYDLLKEVSRLGLLGGGESDAMFRTEVQRISRL